MFWVYNMYMYVFWLLSPDITIYEVFRGLMLLRKTVLEVVVILKSICHSFLSMINLLVLFMFKFSYSALETYMYVCITFHTCLRTCKKELHKSKAYTNEIHFVTLLANLF